MLLMCTSETHDLVVSNVELETRCFELHALLRVIGVLDLGAQRFRPILGSRTYRRDVRLFLKLIVVDLDEPAKQAC